MSGMVLTLCCEFSEVFRLLQMFYSQFRMSNLTAASQIRRLGAWDIQELTLLAASSMGVTAYPKEKTGTHHTKKSSGKKGREHGSWGGGGILEDMLRLKMLRVAITAIAANTSQSEHTRNADECAHQNTAD